MVEVSLSDWQRLPQDSKKVVVENGKCKFYKILDE